MYGFLRDGYRDVEVFSVNRFHFDQLMERMADGEWRPVFDHLSDAISRQTGIRDYMAGEKVIQGFLAAYLSVSEYYVFRSETELKYRKRSEAMDQAAVAAAAREARAQLTRYLADDRLARQFPGVRLAKRWRVMHGGIR